MKTINQPAKIFLLFFFLFGISTKRSVSSWNDASRMATIQSLVEQHTLAIDGTGFEDLTSDKYRFQGNTYSSKPPALAFLGSAVYWPLTLIGVELEDDPAVSYFLITLLTVGVLSALGLAFFWKTLVEFFHSGEKWANLVTVLAGAGTLVLTYSTVFNSHVVCGSLLLLGFYAALKFLTISERKFIVISGLFISLAGSIETSCLIFLPFMFLIFLRDSIKSGLLFAVSCLPMIAFYFGMNFVTSGNLLPPTLNAPLRTASSDTFSGENLSGLTSHETVQQALIYSYHSLVGDRGLISHTPILIFSVLGLFSFFRKKKTESYYAAYTYLVLGSGLYILLAILRTNNYSGNAFGVRWFASIMLILMLSLAFLEDSIRSKKVLRSAFWLVGALSISIAVLGSYRPFLPSTRPVVGDPSVVDHTILVAIERLAALSSLEGKIRTLLLFILAITLFAYLAREFSLNPSSSFVPSSSKKTHAP